MDSRLKTYLEASRKLLPQPHADVMNAAYNALFRHVEAAMRDCFSRHIHLAESRLIEPDKLPPLVVIYSNERTCQIVKVGGALYLIYDQYLGETFHLLTRILYHAGSELSYVQAFGLKCIAQRLVSRGCFPEAMWIAMYYRALCPETMLPKFETDTDRIEVTAAQELFVMAHEVCHYFIKYDDAFRALQLVGAEAAFAQGRRSRRDIPSKPQRKKLREKYGLPVNMDAWEKGLAEVNQFWEANKATNVEEIACDAFARDAVLHYVKSRRLTPVLGFKAAILALRYLRLLHYCSKIADGIASDKPVQAEFANPIVRSCQMRERILRESFSMAHKNIFDPENPEHHLTGWRKLGGEIDRVNDEADQRLHDPLLFGLPDHIEKVRQSTDVHRPVPKEDGTAFTDDEAMSLVEELTGPNL